MGTVVLTGPTQIVSDWQCPPFERNPDDRLAWIEEQIQEGEGAQEGQPSFKNATQNIRLYQGIFEDKKTKSTLSSNFLKYNVRKLVETISEVREIALYGSDAKQYKAYAEMVNRVAKCVYLESFYPRQLRKAEQYASVMGVGYLWPKCKAMNYGYGERRIIFEDLGPFDVTAVQVPKTNDIQDAYAITIYEYMPIAEAHGRFPLWQSSLKPVADTRYSSRVAARRQDFAERIRFGEQGRLWGAQYCEIRYTFIRDLRINNTTHEMPMGDEGTSWFYTVPSVGQEIFGGIRNGAPYTRKATPEDCRVYPQLRLMISTPGTLMYDGPAFDWHGEMPPVQYLVDDVPWEPGGQSLVQDVSTIEQTKRKIERKLDQVITTTLNPPMGYDRTSTGGPKIENFDIFEENVRAGVDGKPKDILQSLLPDEVRPEQIHFTFLEMLTKMEEGQMGINDIGNLANMKLNMSSEAMDKALETVGPIAKGIAAAVESANAKIGYQLKFMIPQWFDMARIIQYIGPDNITPEVYDFDPSSMIPSHTPEELINGRFPQTPSLYDPITRAKRFAKNLRLTSIPSTLVKITQMQEQLKYLQLWRGHAPISFSTVAKKLGIENYGEVPGNTEREKWVHEQLEDLKLKAAAAQLASQLMPGAPGEEGGKTGPHAGGRPPSGGKPPKLKQKGASSGNPRTTVSESG